MNKFHTIPGLIIFIYISILFSQSSSTPIHTLDNEQLTYNLYYNGIRAGEASMVLDYIDTEDSRIVKLITVIRTNSFVDIFYKIRDRIEIIMDPIDFSILDISKSIREGKYRKSYHSTIDYKKMHLYSNSTTTSINSRIYDPLSILYNLRAIDIYNDEVMSYNILSKNKIRSINIKTFGKELISVPYGRYEAVVMSPSDDYGNPVLKNNGEMKIWLTNDLIKIPIQILIKLKSGSITLKLKKITK